MVLTHSLLDSFLNERERHGVIALASKLPMTHSLWALATSRPVETVRELWMVTFIVIPGSFLISTRDSFRGKGTRDIAFYTFPRCPACGNQFSCCAYHLATLESVPLDIVIGPRVGS